MTRSTRFSAAAATALLACTPEFAVEGSGEDFLGEQFRPTDRRAAVSAERTLPPISGGTLLVTRTGERAVLADTETDTVHIVNLRGAERIATIDFDRISQPGRVIEDDVGLVHVVLRRTGEILTLDPETGERLAQRYACANPRGLALHDEDASLLVACAGGNLVRFDLQNPSSPSTMTFVAPDLRDVFVIDGVVMVSLFRKAAVLALNEDGEIAGEWNAPRPANANFNGLTQDLLTPNTAWRTIPDHNGGFYMLHQASANEKVQIDDFDSDVVQDSSAYGGSAFGPSCHSLVASVLSQATRGGLTQTTGALHRTVLAVDAALSPEGDRLAVAVAGQSDRGAPTLERQRSVLLIDARHLDARGDSGCSQLQEELLVDAQPVAVAYDPNGWLLVQTRSPTGLYYFAPNSDGFVEIELDQVPVRDTGFDLFHNDAGAGIACASCHPEGGDDGLVWTFEGFGPRRTQALNVGLRGTEPFHWEGDMPAFGDIVGEVHLKRMGGAQQIEARLVAFEDWLLNLAPPPAFRAPSDADAQRGRAEFVASGCADCHSGEKLTNNLTVTLDGSIALQVPNLVAVGHRAPYMHDGRSASLRAATIDMLERTQKPVPDDAELDDLVAYLESL